MHQEILTPFIKKINLKADIKMLDLLALNISDSAVWGSTKATINYEMDSLHQSFNAKLTETNFDQS